MSQNVVIVTLLVMKWVTSAPTPLQVTVDCSSDENLSFISSKSAELSSSGNTHFNVNSFCNFIQKAIPKAIEDGKFIIESNSENDLTVDGNSPISSIIHPPSAFIKTFPKPRISKLKTPRMNVPKLKAIGTAGAPKMGAPMRISILKKVLEEETSAEKIERFKNGVQKMLHVVKILTQIDQYLSERTRTVVDKLAKTFME